MTSGPAFYCVSSGEYFLGAVGLVNSLRLLGHAEPIHLLDCGLSGRQRDLLAPEANLIEAPRGRQPFTLKPFAPLARPADVMALIDTDMIVTRRLDPLLDAAGGGRVVAFRNHADRFVPEWSALELGPLRRSPYVCSGFVAFAGERGAEILSQVDERQHLVDLERSYFGAHDDDYPLLYADQDLLNAVLAARPDPDELMALEARLAPMVPFAGLRVSDEEHLRCEHQDGTEPFLLHHSLSPKPWQRPGYDGVYSRLLRRLLSGPDVAIRVPEAEIPRDLRTGPLGFAERQRVKAREQLRWRLGGLRRRIGGGAAHRRAGVGG
jgi:hypothetical protein